MYAEQNSQYSTPKKGINQDGCSPRKRRSRAPSLKALENLASGESETSEWPLETIPEVITTRRRSTRKLSPLKRYSTDYVLTKPTRNTRRSIAAESNEVIVIESDDIDDDADTIAPLPVSRPDLRLLQDDETVAGKSLFGFTTPKKRDGMTIAALNTPKLLPRTPQTPQTTGRTTPARRTHRSSSTSTTPALEERVMRLQLRTPTTTASHQRTPTVSQQRTPHSVRRSLRTPDPKSNEKSAHLPTKTPARMRLRVRTQIAKMVEELSGSDFSADSDNYDPLKSDNDGDSGDSSNEDADDESPKIASRCRRPVVVPIAITQTPSDVATAAARVRQSNRLKKKADDFVPASENYFQAHASSKIHTSDHTLDRLRQPRLPADRLFSLLSTMKLSVEHEMSVNAMMAEYHTYFPKWACLLHEGFNLLLYGLGTKRPLLQAFHRQMLAKQPVLVVNGFFPSLTLKDILDSITVDILDAGPAPSSAHEAVDMIEEEFGLIPETHLYLIVHSLDGSVLRTARIQEILARLAHVPNIHLLASIDHINTPLLWDQSRLSQFNFSWWDCTTMLPYTDETAFENSLLVQNSGALAISSLRSVFSSLTTNSRGIFLQIVRHQLENMDQPNYQGMPFKELYWRCREAFLVSSDIALRAQLTEFLDHKLVKSRRHIDGYEQLTVPIDGVLLQQFLDEQEQH